MIASVPKASHPSRLSIWIGLGFVLSAAVVCQVLSGWGAEEKLASRLPLAQYLPAARGLWTMKDHPIAETEMLQARVDEVLNYTEAVYRVYRCAEKEIGVYVAYWKPGRFHPRLIATHTPDNCWVGAGWKLCDSNYTKEVPFRPAVWHAQYREFEQGGVRRHVLYWHLLGGRLSGYAEGPNSKTDAFTNNFSIQELVPMRRKEEQYFIRLSSNIPWEQFWTDPMLTEIASALIPLGLEKK